MQELAKLEKISGIKTSKKMIEDAIAMARKARAERLEGEKRDREKTFKIQYAYALKNQDLKKIVELTAKDQRRVKRGNSSLIEQFKKEKQK